MEISRNAATAKGPAETFTGEVWVDPITRGLPPSQLNVAAVRFTPGARSAWHSHDGGQTLYVTEGHGLVQVRGQQIIELNPGDVVFAPDGEEHWHGASPDHFMTHLSITEGAPHWGPHVTDAEYHGQQDPRSDGVVVVSVPAESVRPSQTGDLRLMTPGAPARHAGTVLPRARGCFHAERTRITRNRLGSRWKDLHR